MKTVTVTRGFSFSQEQLVTYGLLNLVGFPTISFNFDVGDADNATISSEQTGQALVWNGSAWVNGSVGAGYLGEMTGATAGDAGAKGAAPAPAAGDQNKYLAGDGTWKALPATASQDAINLFLHQFFI